MSKKKNNQYIFKFFFIFNIIFQIYYFIFRNKKIKRASDYITIIINISMYLSLNIGVYYGFKENKADRIPILSTVLGLLSSIGWTIYSACLGKGVDDITFYSNMLSIIVLVFIIACYIYLSKFISPIKIETISIKKENEKDIKNDINNDEGQATKLVYRGEDEENQNNDD